MTRAGCLAPPSKISWYLSLRTPTYPHSRMRTYGMPLSPPRPSSLTYTCTIPSYPPWTWQQMTRSYVPDTMRRGRLRVSLRDSTSDLTS